MSGADIRPENRSRLGKHGNQPRGRKHPAWTEGRIVTVAGYVKIRVGKTHPLAHVDGYAYEHVVVWVAANGPIPKGHVVHHRNHEKDDNRLENLELLTASEHASQHVREHQAAHGREPNGRLLPARST